MTTLEPHQQRMDALERGNAVRVARSKDKKLIASGELSALSILVSPPDHWLTAKVAQLLVAMPRVGHRRAENWLEMAKVPATKQLHALTPRQRHALAGYVEYGESRNFDRFGSQLP
jgi:hypothetical protein